MNATVNHLYIYPVKGLPGVAQEEVEVQPGRGLNSDRRFALSKIPVSEQDDLLLQKWQPWETCYVLKQNICLAKLKMISYDTESTQLQLALNGKVWSGSLGSDYDQRSLAEFIATSLHIKASILDSKMMPLWDWGLQAPLSLINLNSIRTIAKHLEMALDQRRFRCNIMIDGLEPWLEHSWPVGSQFEIGSCGLEVIREIPRCSTTRINPETAINDANVPATILKMVGHTNCGLGIRVVSEGLIRIGDQIRC